jgi:capsular polysaccharide biosynthesis protein
MILDVEGLVANLSRLYPAAEVMAVRFRDLNMTEQVRWLSKAKVFITTQGSSGFRLVFLPAGATCIFIGSPSGNSTKWTPFHELNRWFPLADVQLVRYHIDGNSTADYEVKVMPGHWQPADPDQARDWWLHNANVRLRMDRLKTMLDTVFSAG